MGFSAKWFSFFTLPQCLSGRLTCPPSADAGPGQLRLRRLQAGGAGMGEAGRGDLVSVATPTRTGPPQGAFVCRQRRRRAVQFRQDPIDIEQAGRLHHPGDQQVTEDLVAGRIKTQAG